jgi:hypothetical protein
MRYAMRKLVFIFLVLLAAAILYGCSTSKPPPTSAFQNDWTGLFLTVTKSFGVTRTYYLGSDNEWSYFETKGELLFTTTYRKVETSQMKLRRAFPFCEDKPYRIELRDFGYDQKSTNRVPNTVLDPTATASSVSTNR